jgi:hypothetical protein
MNLLIITNSIIFHEVGENKDALKCYYFLYYKRHKIL